MHISWHELLFVHWPLPPEVLASVVPASLPVDTFDGHAWLGIVPFRMTNVGPRSVPTLPWLSAFPELNVRTYVTVGGKPGVFFFSLDAARALAVIGARIAFHLPYFHARMSLRRADGWIDYATQRVRRDRKAATFVGRYRPTGATFESGEGSLESFLTNRYCLYAVDLRGRVFRSEIDHAPWALQPAELSIEANTMTRWLGLYLPTSPPLLHYSERQDVVVWLPERVV
ncbi:MAG TPA: DUF2071 domain-containing protein [Chloroflexota bacterium]